jgi:lactate oxidase
MPGSASRGAAATQVSNHGDRQLDTVPASIVALPGIVEAIGPNIPVFLDGGVRRGVHAFQALALGARAVAAGRPTLCSLALGGAPGVTSMFNTLKTEVQLALKLAGCASINEITRNSVTWNSFSRRRSCRKSATKRCLRTTSGAFQDC